MNKDEIFNAILEKEGGYVNHPDDKGGPTNWGLPKSPRGLMVMMAICKTDAPAGAGYSQR